MSFPAPPRTSDSTILAGCLLIVFLLAWSVFGYIVLFAAIGATTGGLQTALTVYTIGSLIIFFVTMFVKAVMR